MHKEVEQIDELLDTNILIYAVQGEEKYVQYLETKDEIQFGVSVITYLEVMAGVKSAEEEKELLET